MWYADVFLKFRDEQGNISSDDANCLITLYDAAHLRTHGEHVLDSAIVFNRSRLQLLLMRANLEPGLAEEVRLTLETPRFRRVKRVEARRYLAAYEKMPAARDDAILEFAKSDYNIVQALYCEELKELTM
jgi:(-)-germacrene D synthase